MPILFTEITCRQRSVKAVPALPADLSESAWKNALFLCASDKGVPAFRAGDFNFPTFDRDADHLFTFCAFKISADFSVFPSHFLDPEPFLNTASLSQKPHIFFLSLGKILRQHPENTVSQKGDRDIIQPELSCKQTHDQNDQAGNIAGPSQMVLSISPIHKPGHLHLHPV